MIKGDIIKMLTMLDEAEFKKLGKFINSSYFNSNSRVIKLYEILSDYFPGFNAPELSRENLHRKIYGPGKYVDGTMKYLISETESLIERFIGIEKTNPFMLDITFLEELTEHRQYNLFEKKYRAVRKRLIKGKDNDNLYGFLLKDAYSANIDRQKTYLTKKDTFKKELMEPGNELMKFFLKKMLTEIISLLNRSHTFDQKIEIPFINEVNFIIDNNIQLLNDPEIKINYMTLKMLLESDRDSFFQIKEMLTRDHKSLSKSYIKEAINNLQIFCFEKTIEGEDFSKEEFEIAKLRFSLNIYNETEKMNVDVFFKFVSLSMSLEEFDWAKSFIDKYAKSLDEKFQNNAIHYSYARIYYQNRDHDAALSELAAIKNYSFIHYKPAVKILQLMIYYDLKLVSEAEYVANSFIQFLRNDKLISRETKKAYLDFIKIYLKLLKTEFLGKRSKIEELKFKIYNQKKLLVARKWFYSKIEEIELKLIKKL